MTLQHNTLSRAELNYEYGHVMNVHYGDVLIKFAECLDLSTESLPYVTSDSAAVKFSASRLQEGDVIFADTAEDETVGKCTELVEIADQTVVPGLHTIPCRPKIMFSTGYLGYYLNAHTYHDQLIPLMQGIKVASVSKASLQDTELAYPSIEEQAQIGRLFIHLDNLITLHQRKLCV